MMSWRPKVDLGKMAVWRGLSCIRGYLRQGAENVLIPSRVPLKKHNFLQNKHVMWFQFSGAHTDIQQSNQNPLVSVSEAPDTLYKRLAVLVKGHDKIVLDSYEYFMVLAAKELDIFIEKVEQPPRKIERFTLLKSVHIYKKHRVQYEMRTHYRYLELKHLTGSTANVYLEYIQRNLPEGVAMEVKKEKEKQREAELQEKKEKSERMFKEWLKNPRNKPRPASVGCAYANAKLSGQPDGCTYPAPAFYNPIPWKPIVMPPPKEEKYVSVKKTKRPISSHAYRPSSMLFHKSKSNLYIGSLRRIQR